MTTATSALTVRLYNERDESQVLALLSASLGAGPGGRRSREFFRWKHLANPFGRSFMLVAEEADRIVGFRALMRWRFRAGADELRAVRAVDTATLPEYQGRGIFSLLTRSAIDGLAGEADFIFNTPNENSLPGYLKMGWRLVGAVPIGVRIRRPLWFLRAVRSQTPALGLPPPIDAETAAEALRDAEGLTVLLTDSVNGDARLTTPLDADFLRWRYAAAPLLDYRAIREYGDGRLRGLAIFRVRRRGRLWESTIGQVIVPSGDRSMAAQLIRRVADAAPVDHLTAHFPPKSATARAARRRGFVRSPEGMTLTVRPLHAHVDPNPTIWGSWGLSLGDLEVF